MIDPFLLKIILSFIVGATWLTGATIIAERFGSKIGGVIAGLPSTTVLALFFIGWTQSPSIAAESTGVIPAIIGLDAIFTALYILLSHHTLFISIGISLLVWFILSIGFVLIRFNNYAASLIIFFTLYCISFFLGEKVVKVKSEGSRKMVYTFEQIIFRAMLSGTIIALSVIMTRLGGPIIGGVFASFPAIMLSSMIITYLSHGRDFSVAVMKVIMVNGGLNVVIYVSIVRYFYLLFDIVTGTVLAFLISLLTSYITYQFIKRKMS